MPAAVFVKFDGKALQPIRPVDEKELAKLVVGRPYKAAITKPRNPKVHRLYFAAIAAAAKQWPEHEEPLDLDGNADLLRAWLQCKANWCYRAGPFQPSELDQVIKLMRLLSAEDKYGFVRPSDVDGEPGLIVFVSRSIEYEQADDPEFEPVKRAVFDRIEATLGCTIEQLVKADENET